MTSEEKLYQAKRQALVSWLEGEMWKRITFEKYLDRYTETMRKMDRIAIK